MSVFLYKAKSKDALTIGGEIDAENQADAVERVSQLGLLPILVVEKTADRMRPQTLGFRKPRSREIYFFTRQLYNLIKSGIHQCSRRFQYGNRKILFNFFTRIRTNC